MKKKMTDNSKGHGMRGIFVLVAAMVGTAAVSTACRMAPREDLGDTVEARVFEPADTTRQMQRQEVDTLQAVADSVDMFYIGSGSTPAQVQLVSYPSRRDTALYAKGRHLKVVGNADYGHVVRATMWVSAAGDTLVSRLEEVKIEAEARE